jgi:hypothetical protein
MRGFVEIWMVIFVGNFVCFLRGIWKKDFDCRFLKIFVEKSEQCRVGKKRQKNERKIRFVPQGKKIRTV